MPASLQANETELHETGADTYFSLPEDGTELLKKAVSHPSMS